MRTLRLRRVNFHGVAYLPDGGTLVSLNSSRWVRFWDVGSFAERLVVALPAEHVWGEIAFGVQEGLLAHAHRLWDMAPALDRLRNPTAGEGPDTPKGGRPARVDLIPIPLQEERYGGKITIAADGRTVVGVGPESAASWRPRLRVWGRDGRLLRKLSVEGLELIQPLALAPDGRTAAVIGQGVVFLCDLMAGERIAVLGHTDQPQRVLFSPDGSLLACAAGRCVWLWDVGSRKAVKRFRAFRKYAEALAFHPGGGLLAAGSREGEVRVWRTKDLREVARFDWQIGAVHSLAFSPDGMTAAAAGHNSTLVVWDVDV